MAYLGRGPGDGGLLSAELRFQLAREPTLDGRWDASIAGLFLLVLVMRGLDARWGIQQPLIVTTAWGSVTIALAIVWLRPACASAGALARCLVVACAISYALSTVTVFGAGPMLVVGVVIVAARSRSGRRHVIRTIGLTLPRAAWRRWCGLAAGVAIALLSAFAVSMWHAAEGHPLIAFPISVALPACGLGRQLLVAGFCVANAVAEEVVYRWSLPRLLERAHWGPTAAAVAAAAAFGLAHLDGVPSGRLGALMAFAFGVTMAFLAESTGSLVPPILAHAIVDLWIAERIVSLG